MRELVVLMSPIPKWENDSDAPDQHARAQRIDNGHAPRVLLLLGPAEARGAEEGKEGQGGEARVEEEGGEGALLMASR